MEEEDDILDRFTDPNRKRKKREVLQNRRQKRRRTIFLEDKKFARDLFNSKPSEDELRNWKSNYAESETEVTIVPIGAEEDQEDVEWLAEQLGIHLPDPSEGCGGILEFFRIEKLCKAWLHERLSGLGWKSNMTGFDPFGVSYSIPELFLSTWQCYHMAVKQRQWLL